MKKVITPKFRVSFPHIFKPSSFSEDQEKKYSVTMIFEPGTDLSKLKKLMKQTIREKWGSKPPKKLRKPFHKGSEKDLEGYDDDCTYITCSSKMPVGLVGRNRLPITSESDFYAGCYAHATVTCYAYDNKFGKGVAFGLQNIQKLEDGEPFSGRSSPDDDFEVLDGEVDDYEDDEDFEDDDEDFEDDDED